MDQFIKGFLLGVLLASGILCCANYFTKQHINNVWQTETIRRGYAEMKFNGNGEYTWQWKEPK